MRKIPTLFVRDPEDRRYVTSEVTPGCEWVLAGEGVATRKYDGTCVMFDGQWWWARREVKAGKVAPPGFTPVEQDPATGKTIGWEPVPQWPFVRYLREALEAMPPTPVAGTYELIGPKINGNPEREERHVLYPHDKAETVGVFRLAPMDLIDLCRLRGWEGVVWHHPDGRMAKLKVRDFPS